MVLYNLYGSLGIAPTRNCTHFLKIGFVVAGGGFYSYYIHQGNKSDKERKIVRKKLSFMHTKRFNTFFKRWVQFRVGRIPRLPLYISIYILYILYVQCTSYINTTIIASMLIIQKDLCIHLLHNCCIFI